MKSLSRRGRRGRDRINNYLCNPAVPITTDVGSNLDEGEVYYIMW